MPAPSPNVDIHEACGHRHVVANYAHGCAYGTELARAARAAYQEDYAKAQKSHRIADSLLWPLAATQDPDALRDFIAGAHSALEAHLRSLGITICS